MNPELQNCVDALTHTVRQSAAFSIRMSYEIKVLFDVMQHASSRWRMQNLYAKPPLTGSLLEQLEAKVEEEMKRSTSLYDSHLSTKERIELVRQLGATEAVRNEKPVWDLLPEVEELQDIMTAAIQNDVTRWRERSVIWLPRRRSI